MPRFPYGDLLRRRRQFRALRRAIALIALGVAVVVFVSGFVMWAADVHNFPNPWLGMWFALQTVTTVGYGDVVPHTVAGRIFASGVMVLGIAIVSLVTATVASELISRREEAGEERIEEEEFDLAVAIQRIEERLVRIEQALQRPDARRD